MKHFILLLSSALMMAGCAVQDRLTRPDDPLEAFRYDVDAILADTVFIPTTPAVKIVSLDRGDVLYERNSKTLMRPASNTKLLTSSAALGILGTDYRFRTCLLADSLAPDGTVQGPLYIKGYGNPDLTIADLDSMVDQLKAIGVKAISGNIIADGSLFDDLYWGEGWMWDDEPYSYEAAISALSVNKNCVKVSVIPEVPGGGAQVLIDPPTNYVSVINTARTVADSAEVPLKVTRLFKDRLNTLVVSGEIVWEPDTAENLVTVWRPEVFAATLLKERLEADSIHVAGQPVIGVALPWSRELAYHFWPMDSMVINLNKTSDNLSAENSLKLISVARGGIPGTARHGLYHVNAFLSELGVDTTKYYVVD
ncbi:MAG TPA: D-alanyl-D-alanine carboxypeptidase/D-alanyl-D-alanine-endopeptidase, partial [Bacteroidota bacterium]